MPLETGLPEPTDAELLKTLQDYYVSPRSALPEVPQSGRLETAANPYPVAPPRQTDPVSDYLGYFLGPHARQSIANVLELTPAAALHAYNQAVQGGTRAGLKGDYLSMATAAPMAAMALMGAGPAGSLSRALGKTGQAAVATGNRAVPQVTFERKTGSGYPVTKDQTVVDVDVDKLYGAAMKDQIFRDSGGKVPGVMKHLEEGKPLSLPEPNIMPGGSVAFTNGMNRFRALKDLGVKRIPVAVDKSQAEDFERMFGAEAPGIRAYHGSPHQFDRFSTANIGTGEGAQAYGHGLYFAEKEGVARSYRDALGGRVNPNDRRGLDSAWIAAAKSMFDAGSSKEEVAKVLKSSYGDITRKQIDDTIQYAHPGHMYEVNIKGTPEEFLDYDAPLSRQSPQVREALERAGVATSSPGEPVVREVQDGWQVFVDGKPVSAPYMRRQDAEKRVAAGVRTEGGEAHLLTGGRYLRNAPESPEEVSRQLREAGIKGIRYKDAMSRTDMPTYKGATADDLDIEDDATAMAVHAALGNMTAGRSGKEAIAEARDGLERYLKNLERQEMETPEYYKRVHGRDADAAHREHSRGLTQEVKGQLAALKKFKPEDFGRVEGTRNYVVFSDDELEILRRYGIMLPGALGAGAAAGGYLTDPGGGA